MADTPFLMGVLFGFVPAMGFLYILLQRYHSFFDEKRLFRSFLIGLIVGAVASIIVGGLAPTVPDLAAARLDAANAGYLALVAVLVGVLEAMVLAAVLNWKTYRGRRDTPYYGVAMGLGFGAMQGIFTMTALLSAFRSLPDVATWWDLVPVIGFGLYLMGGILLGGAIGGWIGRGTSSGGLPRAIARASAVRAGYIAIFYGILKAPEGWIGYALAFLGLAIGIASVARITLPMLDRVVPPEVLREMDIHNRRVARRVMRDDEPRTP